MIGVNYLFDFLKFVIIVNQIHEIIQYKIIDFFFFF
jgi:hypothetical protein